MRRYVSGPYAGPFVINRASEQARQLLGWWPTTGARSAGTTMLGERAGRVSMGALEQGASWATHTQLGQCIRYTSGTGSRTNLGIINIGAPFSLAAWCVPNYTNTALYPKLICKPHISGSAAPYIIYNIGSTNTSPSKFSMEISSGSGSNTGATAASSITAGTLYHVVGTYDGATMRVFVNGLADGTPVSIALTIGTNDVATYLGTLYGGANNDFDGWIGDTRIYGRCLKPEEIYRLYAPETRWELYEPVRRVWAIDAVASAPVGRKHGPAVQMM